MATPLSNAPAWHALDIDAVETELATGPHGLSSASAAARLARYGPNRLEEPPPPSALLLVLRQFRSPLIYILLAAAAVTLALGDLIDAGVIAVVLGLNAIVGFSQEARAEASVRALMALVAPHARVVREGREWDLPSAELVPGDLVLLESGSRVPADLRLFGSTALQIDESLLTGESTPVLKQVSPVPRAAPLADRTTMAYTGSIVTSGRGRGYVVATGTDTELGAIATELRGEQTTATPLQQRMVRFARVITVAVATGSVLAFAIGTARGEHPAEMFKVAVAVAVSAVPEGLPVAFTVALALGVRRMARRNAIIRRLPAVETLGSTTVIGSDKTGTLTENRMTVQEVWAGATSYSLGDEAGAAGVDLRSDSGLVLGEHRPLYRTLLAGVLANEAEIYLTANGYESQGDPTEAALLIAAARAGIAPEDVRSDFPVYAEIPFEPERQFSASIRQHDGAYTAYVKGAPERILAMCGDMLTDTGVVPLDRDAILDAAAAMAGRGLRVLAMARRVLPAPPTEAASMVGLDRLTFLGLQGMMDPPRAGVREAIAGCREAGLRVVMITGDHAATAQAIAVALGITDEAAPVLRGDELDALDDAALAEALRSVAVFARVAPEHKLRIVRALQRRGEVVAVTGDGVNDAPALKAADIGIAMGKGGTDVARQAADMVLADDDFVSIYAAVEEGRVTFDNIRKMTFFLVSTGAAELVTILVALLLGWPLPYLPAQILWLNLVTNGLQDVALAFEPGERGVLRRPPRDPHEGILSRLLWERTALVGVVMAVGTLALFRWELDQTDALRQAQTVALTTMVLFQVFHVGNSRSESLSVFQKSPLSNRFLFLATLAALAIHVAALYLPPTQYILRVEPLSLDAWVRIIAVATTVLAAMELHKLLQRRRGAAAGPRHRVPSPTNN